MEKEYYVGYLRNPKEKIETGFENIKEYEVILEKDYNDYREIALKEKVYIMDKNEVFDGHKVYKSQAGFIGRIDKKLTNVEANEMIDDIRKNRMEEYIDTLSTLLKDTMEMYLQGEKEYLDERQKFANVFGVDATTISDNPSFKRTH